jgi:hypothetical protein
MKQQEREKQKAILELLLGFRWLPGSSPGNLSSQILLTDDDTALLWLAYSIPSTKKWARTGGVVQRD